MSHTDEDCYAPKAGTTGPRTLPVQRIAVSATGARTLLAAQFLNPGWCRVLAKGANVDVLFGLIGDPIPVVESVTHDGTEGYTVMDGTYHDFWLSGDATHVLWDASASGFLMLFRAGTERTRGY